MTRITALGHVSQATIRAVLHVLRAAHPFVRLDSTEHFAPQQQTAYALIVQRGLPFRCIRPLDRLITRTTAPGDVCRATIRSPCRVLSAAHHFVL